MIKLKQLWAKPKGKILMLVLGMLLMISLLAIVVTPSARVTQLAIAMQNAKQTVVKGDVKLTTQETLKTIGGQETRLANQLNSDEATRNAWEKSQALTSGSFKKQLLDTLESEKSEIQKQLQNMKHLQAKQSLEKEALNNKDSFNITNDTTVATPSTLTWIADASATVSKTSKLASNNDDLLQSPNTGEKHPKIIPYYTIPENTALVNIRPLQPLIGVIPTDGTVIDPETVLFSVGRKGLLANNQILPLAIKGVQGSATCTGVFNFDHSSVKCSIVSLTFIFTDGRITTINGSTDKPLGKLTDHYGNDYIPGKYYGNAAYAAAGNALFSGVQGWGGAFANSQVQTQSNATGTFSNTTFKNADNYAAGLALQNAGQSMNNWWNKLLKSTTNYVLVPNWNKDSHKLLLLNAVITSSVQINYDPSGRKVNYDTEENTNNNSLD